MLNIYDALEPDVRPYVIGVPDFVLKPAMSNALYDFCNECACWTEDQTLDAFDDDILLYANDPLNAVVIGVEWVKAHGGTSYYHHTFKSGALVLEFKPKSQIDVRLILANNKQAHALMMPDWMVDQHHRALTHLVCYYLMTQDGKPWANAQMAAYHYTKYREYLGDAVIKATPDRVKMRPFC